MELNRCMMYEYHENRGNRDFRHVWHDWTKWAELMPCLKFVSLWVGCKWRKNLFYTYIFWFYYCSSREGVVKSKKLLVSPSSVLYSDTDVHLNSASFHYFQFSVFKLMDSHFFFYTLFPPNANHCYLTQTSRKI